MRKRALGILRAIGVLAVVWSILGVIAWVGADLPAISPVIGGGGATATPPATPDGGAAGTSDSKSEAGAAQAPRTVDAGSPPSEASAARRPAAVERHAVCEGAVTRPSMRALDVIGDPRPELVVGCGAVVHVLAVRTRTEQGSQDGTGTFLPLRVASFDATRAASKATVHAAPAAAGDVDGDSRPDLVLGFWFVRQGSGSRGGALYLVRGDVTGAFAPPRRLATIATVDVGLHPLDERPGLDIVALKRGNELARRPGEVWVFGGGPSPARRAKLKTGIGAEALAIGDLDGDDHDDLVAATSGTPRVDAFFGDKGISFPRSTTLSIADAREMVAGPSDGMGRTHVWVAAAGLHRVTTRSGTSLRAEPVDAPPKLRALSFAGLGDGRARGLLASVDRRVVHIRRVDEEGYRPEDVLQLPEEAFAPHSMAVADLDADGDTELVLVGRSGDDAPWELVFVETPKKTDKLAWPGETSLVRDAPLKLRITLRPTPNRP